MRRNGHEETDFDRSGPAAQETLPTDLEVRQLSLQVLEGPDAGAVWTSSGVATCCVGSHPSNDLVLRDRTVSRFHCEARLDEGRPRVRDLGSRNGTLVDGVAVVEAFARHGSVLRLGQTSLSLQVSERTTPVALSPRPRFGSMVGRSVPMRALFSVLKRAAASDATVLLEGETGTGKEVAAQSIHEASARRDGPFVIVDCSAIPSSLLESELFGHERGAFTNAVTRRDGAFHAAAGGTVFLDEIGELPAELQPKVLRVLETKAVRRIGGQAYESVDVRFVAATNRNLKTEVNEGRFRPDLYYRLAVVRVEIPPLRARPEDVPLLVEHILSGLGADPVAMARLVTPETLSRLGRAAWPGNVRELRNYLERCLVLDEPGPISPDGTSHGSARQPPDGVDPDLPFADARQRAISAFERRYAEALLARYGGHVASAAEAAGMSKVYLYRLLRRHGIRK